MRIFNFIKNTKNENFSLENLKKDIHLLEDSEKHIWNLHNEKDLENLLENINQRNAYITNLNGIVSNIIKNQNELANDLKSKHPMLNINFKDIYYTLEQDLKNLVNISKSQIELLNQSSHILDTQKRESILNGEKIVPDLSQISSTIKTILEKIEKELPSIPQNSDNRADQIKERFEIRENTIYDKKTKLEWEKYLGKRGKMDWESAMKINENNFKLPSREDFKTLNINGNETGFPKREDLEEIGIIPIKYNYFWTNEEYDTSFAWSVYLGGGTDYYVGKTNAYYVVCVRRD